MNSFCPYCLDMREISDGTRNENIRVKGQDISIPEEYSKCNECGKLFYSMDQEERNIEKAYSIYREKNGLLTTESIKQLRERYKLSQRQFARLLGWSETIISQYESGRIPDRAHNDMLMLLQDPQNMMLLYHKNKELLKENERNRVGERIRLEVLKPRLFVRDCDELVNMHLNFESSEFTGNRTLNFERFINLILIIVNKTGGILKTSLNKIPFYIDFLNYKMHNESITGMRYLKRQFGPVPDEYERVFALLKNWGMLSCTEVQRGEYFGELYTTDKQPKYDCFSGREIQIIEGVISKFVGLNASQIVELSHKEDAYLQTEIGKSISYNLAHTLKIDAL
ncbi:MAG: DUF4065 domain-containing protein [Candidatus Zixiibacteriota bacterium]